MTAVANCTINDNFKSCIVFLSPSIVCVHKLLINQSELSLCSGPELFPSTLVAFESPSSFP